MDGPIDIRYELTSKGRQYLDLQLQASDLKAQLYLSDADEATKTHIRERLYSLQEEIARLLDEP